MPSLTPQDIDQRIPVWNALSDLFLANEFEEVDYRYLAKRLNESGYPIEQLESILITEIAPVFSSNLNALALSETMGWDAQWIQQAVLKRLYDRPTWSERLVRRLEYRGKLPGLAQERWNKVRRLLESHADPLPP